MYESYFHSDDEHYFMVHSELKASRPTLLFIHGLGDAHIDMLPYLNSSLAQHYNILIPDLLGYGKSSSGKDYSFQHQVEGIKNHLDYLQKKLNPTKCLASTLSLFFVSIFSEEWRQSLRN